MATIHQVGTITTQWYCMLIKPAKDSWAMKKLITYTRWHPLEDTPSLRHHSSQDGKDMHWSLWMMQPSRQQGPGVSKNNLLPESEILGYVGYILSGSWMVHFLPNYERNKKLQVQDLRKCATSWRLVTWHSTIKNTMTKQREPSCSPILCHHHGWIKAVHKDIFLKNETWDTILLSVLLVS